MKKFEFHMEKLLSYKGQILDSELMNLAVLNSMLYSAQERLQALKDECARYVAELQGKIREQTTTADCRVYVSYEQHMKEQIKLCEKEIEDLTEQIENQIERVKDLKIETKSLETIKESRFVEYKKEDLKRTELLVDEFVSTARIMRNVFQ